MPEPDLSQLEIVGEFYDRADALHHVQCLEAAEIEAMLQEAAPEQTDSGAAGWHIYVRPGDVDRAVKVLEEAEGPPTLTGGLAGLGCLPVFVLGVSVLTMLAILLLRNAGIL